MMIIMDGTVDAFLYLGSVPWTFFFLVSIDIPCVSLSSFDVLFKNRRIRRDVGVVFIWYLHGHMHGPRGGRSVQRTRRKDHAMATQEIVFS